MNDIAFDPFAGGDILRLAPTTAPQREILASARLSDEANTAFNEAISLHAEQRLDYARLCSALDQLVERHEALRCTFSAAGDSMCLHPPRSHVLQHLNLASSSEREWRAARQDLLRNVALSPMNLQEGPLLHAWLLDAPDGSSELIMAMHHVVCDGWSIGLIVRELAALYNDPAGALDTPPSYFEWADQDAASRVANPDLDYWRAQFATLPPPLDLPLDRMRPAQRRFSANRTDVQLDADVVRAARQAGRTLKASHSVYLLAGYIALLHRLSGSEDIVVGVPLAGQAAHDRTGQVGHMVQLLPVRVQPHADMPFDALVAQVRSAMLDASEHPRFTFGELMDLVPAQRDRVPLISTMFNLDQALDDIVMDAAAVRLSAIPRAAENFELFLNLVPDGDGLTVEATYATSLFDQATVQAWVGALQSVIAHSAADPSVCLADLRLGDGVAAVQQTANQTDRVHPEHNLLAQLAEHAHNTPQRPAASFADQTLSYRELHLAVEARAAAFVAQGAGSGQRVAVWRKRSLDLLIDLLAIWRAGACYVPLDPEWPAYRCDQIVADCQARFAAADPAAERPQSLSTLTLLKGHVDGAAVLAEACADGPEQTAYLIYTSGSTGVPKGVCVSHANLHNLLHAVSQRPGLKADDCVLALTTIAFDIAALELFAPLLVGGHVVIASEVEARDAHALGDLLESWQVNVMQATPATWHMLVRSAWGRVGRVKPTLKALCGGEALPPSLARELAPRVAQLWNMYGPTETTIWSSCVQVDPTQPQISIGQALDNTQLYVVDRTLQPLPVGVPGELCIAGAGVAQGYHQRDELNRERFLQHPQWGAVFRTGDRARLRADGHIEHLGRFDDQIKLRGFRIELGDIETSLKQCPGIDNAVAYVWQGEDDDARLVACCVCKPGATLSAVELRRTLRGRLPGYMMPQHFLPLDAIPLNANGKLDRKALPRPASATATLDTASAFQNETEAAIGQVWRELLRIDGAVGREDNFFELGGHSLLAMEAIRRMEAQTGGRVSPQDMVRHCVAELARLIRRADENSATAKDGPVALAPNVARDLTAEQARMLAVQLKQPNLTAFNLPAAWVLRGQLDGEALRMAVQRVFERHSALRMMLSYHAAHAQFALIPSAEMELPQWTDLRGSENPMEQARTDIAKWALRPFDMHAEALSRLRVYQLADDLHVLGFCAHQLIFDGWSFDILLREIEQVYRATRQGVAAELAAMPVSFGDVTSWLRARPVSDIDVAYHQRALQARVPQHRLLRAQAQAPQFQRDHRPFDATRVDKLREHAERKGLKLHELLLATVALAVRDLQCGPEVQIGLPLAGRKRPEVIGLIGSFVSTLPVLFSLDSGRDSDDIEHVAQTLRDFYAHDAVTLGDLLHPGDDPQCPGVLSFSYQDVRNRPTRLDNLALLQIAVERRELDMPMEVWVHVHNAGMDLYIDADLGRVEDGVASDLMARISERLVQLSAVSDLAGATAQDAPLPRWSWRRLFEVGSRALAS